MLNDTNLDLAFRALADPTRRAMVALLSRGPATVSDLATPLALSLPAALQHLARLEASGLVRTRKSGRVRLCRIDRHALERTEAWLGEQRRAWEDRLDRLDAFLAEEEKEEDHGRTS